MSSHVHVFAYGSNMYTPRIRAWVASAVPHTTGYVTHRRLAFHKRGADGSAKADAAYTGRAGDRIWGVVFRVARFEKPSLDAHEWGYEEEQVVVIAEGGRLRASMYVARIEMIEPELKPFSWYHRLVTHGAIQHGLPSGYIDRLHAFESLLDPDAGRRSRHLELIDARGGPAASGR